ncbi:ribonuclease H2, subunit B [Syncephalis plumigaleata]|nr:ribonuclease H2, subunit B [Syncephalis plumigaleata]
MHTRVCLKKSRAENSETNSSSISSDLLVVSLPHPRTGFNNQYAIDGGQLLELQQVNPPDTPASWFINDTVQQDGSLLLFTPIDPLFILLPMLVQCRRQTSDSLGVYCSQQDILDSMGDEHGQLMACLPSLVYSLDRICDTQVIPGYDKVYRLNDERVIAWLKYKIERIVNRFDSFTTLKNMERTYIAASTPTQSSLSTVKDADEERKVAFDNLTTLLERYRQYQLKHALVETTTAASEAKGRRKTTTTTTTTSKNSSKTKTTTIKTTKAAPPKGMMSLRSYFKPKTT